MKKLDALMTKHGITNSELAAATGYHRNHISRVRSEKVAPTIECMAEILRYLRKRLSRVINANEIFNFDIRRNRARRKAS